MTMISEVSNMLLQRKELALQFAYKLKVTPKKDEVVKDLSEFLKVDAACIFLKKIHPLFGKQEAIVTAHVYENPKQLKKIEVINKKPKKLAGGTPQQAKA